MLSLGSYRFSLSTAAYNEMERTAHWRWPSQDVLRAMPVRQWVGPGDRTINLSGLVLPHYKGLLGLPNLVSRLPLVAEVLGQLAQIQSVLQRANLNLPFLGDRTGRWQLDALRADAEQGVPLLLIDGSGRNWGYWVVDSLTERANDHFMSDGAELRVEFDVRLSYYGPEADANIAAGSSLVGILRNILGI
jgi:phage protein U